MAFHRGVCIAAAVLAWTACGDDGGPAPDPFEACAAAPVTDTTFELDTANPAPQIHADFAFIGGRIWMAYNLVDGEGAGGFDVFVTTIGCDGVASAPQRVTTTTGRNDIDPVIDRRGDSVYIAWSSDSSMGSDNLDLLYRSYAITGEPIMANDRILDTTLAGAPVQTNTWLPDVAGLPDDRAAIIGVRGIDNVFQTFIQRVDSTGDLLGEAIDVTDRGVGHGAPAIASTAAGDVYAAWERSEGGGDPTVWYGLIAADATGFALGPVMATAGASSLPSLAVDRDRGLAYLAVRDQTLDDIVLIALDETGELGRITLGATGEIDHSPVIAVSPSGGAVGWYRTVSGIRNRFVVQRFDFDGAVLSPGSEIDLGTDGAVGVYSPALIHIGDDIYFAAWSEGTAPEFFVKGRAVRTR